MSELELSAKLLAEKLATIDFSDIEELKAIRMTNDEDQARASAADTFFNSHMEKKLKLMTHKQLIKSMSEAVNDSQLQFGRGAVYGIALVNEWFIAQKNIVAARRDQPVESKIEDL